MNKAKKRVCTPVEPRVASLVLDEQLNKATRRQYVTAVGYRSRENLWTRSYRLETSAIANNCFVLVPPLPSLRRNPIFSGTHPPIDLQIPFTNSPIHRSVLSSFLLDSMKCPLLFRIQIITELKKRLAAPYLYRRATKFRVQGIYLHGGVIFDGRPPFL